MTTGQTREKIEEAPAAVASVVAQQRRTFDASAVPVRANVAYHKDYNNNSGDDV